MSVVHIAFIAIPIGIYLTTFFVTYPIEYMPLSYSCVAVVTQHGSGSTFLLLTTNNSVRKVAIEIVSCKKRLAQHTSVVSKTQRRSIAN
ncbi:unnamed protein product [Caenorhabditis angaria]|uniref:Uncharacterized protein n=1 Tax=Caenorhabditis angaria TaxID=860376 RepID=A0A9P1IVJ8_9PELO|nr:unnamed protein product [Caenorhabditis angaria]